MKKLRFVFLCLVLTLAGCTTYSPIPEGYLGDTATINDSFSNNSSTTAHFFMLSEIDGNKLVDSWMATRSANHGRGTFFTPKMKSWEVLPEAATFTLVGLVFFPTDAQALFGDAREVEGTIQFTPDSNEVYTVRGQITEESSEVWLEDSSGKIVKEKIVKVRGD